MTTETTNDHLFAVLHALHVKGRANAEGLALALDTTGDEAGARLTELHAAGLAEPQGGQLELWALTADGRARHDEGLTAEREHGRGAPPAGLERAYRSFQALNHPFKALCTAWQTGDDPSSYIDRLQEVDQALRPILHDLAAIRPRFGPYRTRFARALSRVTSGDASGFTHPLTDSYHDVWMELHEDLLQTLDRPRTPADGV